MKISEHLKTFMRTDETKAKALGMKVKRNKGLRDRFSVLMLSAIKTEH